MASPAPPPPAAATAAQARWELENEVGAPPPPIATDAEAESVDALYTWDPATAAAAQRDKPWARDPHWFQR